MGVRLDIFTKMVRFIVAVTLLATLVQSVPQWPSPTNQYQKFGNYYNGNQVNNNPFNRYTYQPTFYATANQLASPGVDPNSPTWKRPQPTTQVYLGSAMTNMMYAIRNFLKEVPFVTPKLLNTIPFVPPVSGTQIRKGTTGGFNAAFNTMMDAIEKFLAKPELLDPKNYPDPVVAQQIAIARQQLAELTVDLKSYFRGNDETVAFIDQILGGFLVESEASEPKTLATVPLPRDTARAMTENEFRNFKTEMFAILDEVVPAVQGVANSNPARIFNFFQSSPFGIATV